VCVIDPDRHCGPARGADEHRRGFLTFVAGLLGDFARYLARGDIDLARDHVGYRQRALWLSDEEMRQLLDDLVDVLAARRDLSPSSGRTRRLLTTVVMPADSPAGKR
jgi:hypothetical protein